MLEAVPNFSEAQNAATLAALGEALASGGARVADVHTDRDHGRSVFTVFGASAELVAGLVSAVTVAVERIDLTTHAGVHPRVGACDVLPVVPLRDLHPEGGNRVAAAEVASAVAAAAGGLGVPVLRYGQDAGDQSAFAGALRTGGLAGLTARLASGELTPPHGPRVPHPTAGAILVGVRDVLVAFNVELDSADLGLARQIAAAVRERGGGLPGVRALGMALGERGTVQVSTNVERWRSCSPARVLREVAALAAAHGVTVRRAELVGLAPAAAVAELHRACAEPLDGSPRNAPRNARTVQLLTAAEPSIEAHLRVG